MPMAVAEIQVENRKFLCNEKVMSCRPWVMNKSPGDEEASKDPAARQPGQH
jgi:hypothetical protein